MKENESKVGFELPPQRNKRDGSPRLVGFELEFSGIGLDDTVAALRSALGGTVLSASAAEQVVEVEALGKFNVELDWAYLKRKAAETEQGDEGGEWLEQLSQAAALLVPIEVVCPPIPLTQLTALDPMVAALRKAGAVGTDNRCWQPTVCM